MKKFLRPRTVLAAVLFALLAFLLGAVLWNRGHARYEAPAGSGPIYVRRVEHLPSGHCGPGSLGGASSCRSAPSSP